MIRIGSVKNTYPYFEKHVFQWQFRPLNIFPLTFEEITVTPYRKRHKNYTKTQIRKILSGDFQNYCKEMKKKGVEIIQNDVKIYTGSETVSYTHLSGRRRPIEIPGSEYEIELDTVIMSLGTSPNPLISSTTKGLETNKRKCIVAEEELSLIHI